MLHLSGELHSVQGMYGCSKDCVILIPFRLPQISCFTLSLKWFSSDSDNCPEVGIGPLSPTHRGQVQAYWTKTLLFFPPVPSSYWVLHGSICSFPLVSYSSPLPASVPHALLCLKVYSWWIHGKRYIRCSPTPPPSYSVSIFFKLPFALWFHSEPVW